MEMIEAYVWAHPDELVPIQESSQGTRTCSKVNQRLTVFLWLFILPWQPLCVIIPCRRVGHPDNRQLLKVPEFLAIVYGFCNLFLYLVSSLPQLSSNMIYRSLAESNFKSYLHTETCTYLGASGHHLQWAYSLPDMFLAPNGYTYFLLWLSVAFARPLRYAAGIFLVAVAIFFVQFIYFDLSWEAGSVWCWAAIILHVYAAVQPYVLPCAPLKTGSEMTAPLLPVDKP